MKNIPEQQKCFKSSVTPRSIYECGGLNNRLPSMGYKSMGNVIIILRLIVQYSSKRKIEFG